MADSSAPLLSQGDEESDKIKPEEVSGFTFDKVMEQSLSSFGFSQFVQTFLVGFASFFDSQQIFITVFADAYPTWHCVDRTICNPVDSDICQLPRSAWDWDDVGSKGKSIISSFGLECSSSLLRDLPTSAFYVGCVVGGFLLAMIPDTFLGRKKLLFFSTLATSLTGIAISLSPNVWIYSLLKFMIGFARSLLGTYVVVLITERVGTRWRPRAGMIPFTLFVLGFMSLSGIAYIARNFSWRVLYLCTSIPAAIYSILLYLFAFESPRWLSMVGRNEEAKNVLEKISKTNKATLVSLFALLPLTQESKDRGRKYSIKDLFIRKWALRRISTVMVIAFGIGMSYYGVPLAVRGVNVNIYVGEALNALVELPSFVLTPFLLEKFNRRSSLLTCNLIGGITGISCFVLSVLGKGKLGFVLELACFFCSRMGFNLMMVYVVEMFPTCVRNSATTMARQALVVGGICSPMISSIGLNVPLLPFAVFGASLFVFGLFGLLLPETKGSSLCDTMEEQEEKDRLGLNASCRC
ncbi:PREDICTED: organic cation/carnitine transporter 5-like [Tarenaya hassleriana]|uniref:organic cation/carnitine transporter 5-like n=1 Tax=Tarenaya hassleriana TaxID=28532 RepID=UPI00053C4660|nr:PREDICTED: organic cation/carnitine transporter 5-like [Tarenaya hassleriana]XP_010539567.1 PREDICTED: organic cation/carnitine transporter 5-like [Tarenaya hassleriana]XP_010539568.1 PREDICTED: organic cation/carnitine transporter 5-like [Tarenaya hassleriana]